MYEKRYTSLVFHIFVKNPDDPMGLPKYFISCDWGTSNFRLRVTETNSLRVLAEHTTDQGVKTVYEKYQDQSEADQFQFFFQRLKAELQQLPEQHWQHPVVASGMASSSIGLWELPYADLPFNQNGEQLRWKHITEGDLDLVLISGVKSTNGVMRGEEVEAVGLEEYLSSYPKGILLLPGTHSKHIGFSNKQFRDFKTFMTGELFDILSKQSILARSVVPTPLSNNRANAFQEGLEVGLARQLAPSLFTIRAKHLLYNHNPEDGYYKLSGMLIGDELSYLKEYEKPVILAASDPVFSLYKLALESIITSGQLLLIEGKILEKALLVGQRKILALHGN